MNITTQRFLIQNVAKRWRECYNRTLATAWVANNKPISKILSELESLDLDTATAEQVNEIIGNSSWTRLKCDECQKEVDAVIRVGEEPDIESQTAHLCRDCVKKAAEMLE